MGRIFLCGDEHTGENGDEKLRRLNPPANRYLHTILIKYRKKILKIKMGLTPCAFSGAPMYIYSVLNLSFSCPEE